MSSLVFDLFSRTNLHLESLQLLAMRRTKGREYDAVAMVDCHEGKLPHFDADTVEEVEEARRFMYVAATRGRKVLMFFTDSSHPKRSHRDSWGLTAGSVGAVVSESFDGNPRDDLLNG